MSRLARRTVTWRHRDDDQLHTCTYVVAAHHEHKAEAKAVNAAADQSAVAAYNNAATAGTAVIVGIDTTEVADGT